MEKPPVFGEEGLEAAGARAVATGKWLLVDATAPWCQPCKLMDRTTWRDPAVEAWIAEHAVAGGVDAVHVRLPGGSAHELLALTRAVRKRCPGARVLVNDRLDIALLADAAPASPWSP